MRRDRKGQITLSPLSLRNGKEYRALAGAHVLLSLKSKPQKVEVFVDYEEGLVSFYDEMQQLLFTPLLAVTSLRNSTRSLAPVVLVVA